MGESVIVLLFEYFSWIDFLHGEISERLSACSWYSNEWGRKAATNVFRFTFLCLICSVGRNEFCRAAAMKSHVEFCLYL